MATPLDIPSLSVRDIVARCVAACGAPIVATGDSRRSALKLTAAVSRVLAAEQALKVARGASAPSAFTERRLEEHFGTALFHILSIAAAESIDLLPMPTKAPIAPPSESVSGDEDKFSVPDLNITPTPPRSAGTSPNKNHDSNGSICHDHTGLIAGLRFADLESLDTPTPGSPDITTETRAKFPLTIAVRDAQMSIRDIPTVDSTSASPTALALLTSSPMPFDSLTIILPPAVTALPPPEVRQYENDSLASTGHRDISLTEVLQSAVIPLPAATTTPPPNTKSASPAATSVTPPLGGRVQTPGMLPRSTSPQSHVSPPALKPRGVPTTTVTATGPMPLAAGRSWHGRAPTSPSGQPLFGLVGEEEREGLSDDDLLGTLNAAQVMSIHSTSASPCGTRLLPNHFRRMPSPKPASTLALATTTEANQLAPGAILASPTQNTEPDFIRTIIPAAAAAIALGSSEDLHNVLLGLNPPPRPDSHDELEEGSLHSSGAATPLVIDTSHLPRLGGTLSSPKVVLSLADAEANEPTVLIDGDLSVEGETDDDVDTGSDPPEQSRETQPGTCNMANSQNLSDESPRGEH
jgi:hypothetical protein